MTGFLSSGFATGAVPFMAAITLDGMIVSGLVALVIGMIAWSKYTEPPIRDAYANRSISPASPVTGPTDSPQVDAAQRARPAADEAR
jgi:hypothetical protein